MYPVDHSAWVGNDVRDALVLALHVRREGANDHCREDGLERACRALSACAKAQSRGPEHVLDVFRVV
ncbi:hypothetical protein BH11GEM1_BH11GEM1_08380 [soil metagenome]